MKCLKGPSLCAKNKSTLTCEWVTRSAKSREARTWETERAPWGNPRRQRFLGGRPMKLSLRSCSAVQRRSVLGVELYVDCMIRVHKLYSYTAIVEQERVSRFVPNLLHNWGSSQLWVPAWNKVVVVTRTTLSKAKRRARQWKVDMTNLEWSSRTCWVVWVMKAAVGSFGPSSSSLANAKNLVFYWLRGGGRATKLLFWRSKKHSETVYNKIGVKNLILEEKNNKGGVGLVWWKIKSKT